jgi:hypothetical protein
VNHRADEVHTDLLSGTGVEDVSPELLAFLQRPRIGALINGDDELGDGTQDLQGLGFCGFHEQNNAAWMEQPRASELFSAKAILALTFLVCLQKLSKANCSSIGGQLIFSSLRSLTFICLDVEPVIAWEIRSGFRR